MEERSGILDSRYLMLDPGAPGQGCWILDTGFSILDSRYWILDTGYWIQESGPGWL
ncbi:MAG: hypothetical protein ACETWQ_10985 [Phycisphaerae bacterium]